MTGWLWTHGVHKRLWTHGVHKRLWTPSVHKRLWTPSVHKRLWTHGVHKRLWTHSVHKTSQPIRKPPSGGAAEPEGRTSIALISEIGGAEYEASCFE